MAANVRPELANKNKYRIDRHRYYELRHFCLQYPNWLEFYSKLDGYSAVHYTQAKSANTGAPADTVPETVEKRESVKRRMDLVEEAAKRTDAVIGPYIFRAVTTGLSYEHLRAKYSMPCGKSQYYDLYRKFFWILDRIRQ